MTLKTDVFDARKQSATCAASMRPQGGSFASAAGRRRIFSICARHSRGVRNQYLIFLAVPGTCRGASGGCRLS